MSSSLASTKPSASEILRSLTANWWIVVIGTMMVTMTTVSFYMITAYTPTFGDSVLHLASEEQRPAPYRQDTLPLQAARKDWKLLRKG